MYEPGEGRGIAKGPGRPKREAWFGLWGGGWAFSSPGSGLCASADTVDEDPDAEPDDADAELPALLDLLAVLYPESSLRPSLLLLRVCEPLLLALALLSCEEVERS